MTLRQLRRHNAYRLRMERAVPRLMRLGARPVLELLAELGTDHGILPHVVARLEAYGELDPAMVRAIGADRIEPRRLVLVSSR